MVKLSAHGPELGLTRVSGLRKFDLVGGGDLKTAAMSETSEKPRLRLLLDHSARIEDAREPWRVAHPLPEVLRLVVCGTIAAGDDFEDIADWGADNLAFLRRVLPYHHGVPGARWLRLLMNRIDPALFAACFQSWAAALRPHAPDLVAIDGKTSRGSHNRGRGRAGGAISILSAS